MTNAKNNDGSRFSFRLLSIVKNSSVTDANYSLHLQRIRRKLDKFTPTVNGDERIDFVIDLMARSRAVTRDHDWSDHMAKTEAPEEIIATVVRTSNGTGLLWWPDEYVFMAMIGLPSLSVGTTVKLSKRHTETQNMKAAKRVSAQWMYGELESTLMRSSVMSTRDPGFIEVPVFTINSAFFSVEKLSDDPRIKK